MKDVLNFFGVFFSVLLSILLTILIFVLGILLNVKILVNKNGLKELVKNIDFVEVIKSSNDLSWDELVKLGEDLNLNESQVEKFINSDAIKNECVDIFSDALSSAFKGENVEISKDDTLKLIDVIIDEYNEVSDEDISPEVENQLKDFINDDIVKEINKSLADVDMTSEIPAEYNEYYNIALDVAYGQACFILIGVIVFIIALIALLRFSYYKWMPYFGVSSSISGVLLLAIGLLINSLNNFVTDIDVKSLSESLFGTVSKHILIYAAVLIGLAILAFVLHHILKKNYLKKHDQNFITETN